MENYIKIIKRFFDLKKIYILIFITLALWSIFAYNTITNLINSQKIYAEIINLSGKQRMLSQKTTLIGKRFLEHRGLSRKRWKNFLSWFVFFYNENIDRKEADRKSREDIKKHTK